MSKGSARRQAQINEYLNKLNWLLKSDDTDAGIKENIIHLHTLKSELQSKIADITTAERDREIYRKVIDGELPYMITPLESKTLNFYFPWSNLPKVVERTKESKDLITTLVLIEERK